MTHSCRLLATGILVAAIAVLTVSATQAEEKGSTRLFNGRDLTGFYTWLKGHGKNKDPEKVFTVKDGILRISGETWGGLVTEKDYENYHLTVEFKWGEKTYGSRADKARDSGILLHCVGEDGAAGGTWMESIECQLIEGGTGDIILVGAKGKPSVTAEVEQRGKENYFKPGAPARKFTGGRINWYGRDPEWKDKLGFRGSADVEKPVGEWNTLECICQGDKLTYLLNGKKVNEATQASHTKGKLLIQSEGAELFVRRVDLKPL